LWIYKSLLAVARFHFHTAANIRV